MGEGAPKRKGATWTPCVLLEVQPADFSCGPSSSRSRFGQEVDCMSGVARSGDALKRSDENRIRIPAACQLSCVLRVAGDNGAGLAAYDVVRADLGERAAGDGTPVSARDRE